MITPNLINNITTFSREQSEKYKLPSLFHLDVASEKGKWIAEKLGANVSIVQLGTLLMDCMLGSAFEMNKMSEHIQMSVDKARELLQDDDQLTKDEMENIIKCIEQHHGSKEFYSLEAEICCNADCYRFASVKGFLGGLINGPAIPTDKRIAMFLQKADEKWGILSLDICKEELAPQYEAIKALASHLK